MAEDLAEFEIFYDLGEGAEPWELTCVRGLENAKTVMRQVATKMPGRYFVWDALKGEVIARLDSSAPWFS